MDTTIWRSVAAAGAMLAIHHAALAARYPVLKASKGADSVLLVGSLHVGVADPERAAQARALVGRGAAVCLETSQDDLAGAEADGRIMFLNPPGSDLRSRVGDAAYKATVAHLGCFIDDGNRIDALSPFAVSIILTMNMKQFKDDTLTVSPATSPDADIVRAARQLGKPLLAIEKPGAARAAFARITDTEWTAYIKGMLAILDCATCARQYSENMIKANRLQSDYEALHRQLGAAMVSAPQMVALTERLNFGQRNHDMAAAIAQPLDQRKCDLIAVGHLGGANGLAVLLRQAGWKVEAEPAEPTQAMPAPAPQASGPTQQGVAAQGIR